MFFVIIPHGSVFVYTGMLPYGRFYIGFGVFDFIVKKLKIKFMSREQAPFVSEENQKKTGEDSFKKLRTKEQVDQALEKWVEDLGLKIYKPCETVSRERLEKLQNSRDILLDRIKSAALGEDEKNELDLKIKKLDLLIMEVEKKINNLELIVERIHSSFNRKLRFGVEAEKDKWVQAVKGEFLGIDFYNRYFKGKCFESTLWHDIKEQIDMVLVGEFGTIGIDFASSFLGRENKQKKWKENLSRGMFTSKGSNYLDTEAPEKNREQNMMLKFQIVMTRENTRVLESLAQKRKEKEGLSSDDQVKYAQIGIGLIKQFGENFEKQFKWFKDQFLPSLEKYLTSKRVHLNPGKEKFVGSTFKKATQYFEELKKMREQFKNYLAGLDLSEMFFLKELPEDLKTEFEKLKNG